ncbi:MAG TPA: DNA-processing protein DprA [Candidatus Nanopelagicaceae bacterium]
MNSEVAAHLILLSLFEGGNEYWSSEYLKYGAQSLVERISAGEYVDYKKSGYKLANTVQEMNPESLHEQMVASQAFLITRHDSDWPAGLDDLKAPPIALIGRGTRTALFSVRESLSIVGTRNPSEYGARVAGDFAAGAVDRGWSIISGGAFGIDSAAHKGAIIAEGQTIAILGGGVNSIFPSGNDRLFREIMQNGLLLSEVLPNVHAIPARFLIRNRLIAAISRATVVIEAAFRSGSLRTARDAAEIFRPVMAVPGPITSPTSDGCHRLIGERTAEIVTSIADCMELVGPLSD